ncbi:MAG: DUF2959 domain-containing protein [Planctomycetota bacterium]|nr:MAG: DUF2959 domain-containing protein [Planctomycetota bacterium]
MRRTGTAVMAIGLLGLGLAWMGGCASASMAIKEQFGYAKREQLVDGVQKARDAQEDAKEQFASALEEFIAVTRVDGGELEATYKRLQRELERSEDRAESVRDRITSVERVGGALFREWEQELSEYSSESLRASSREQLEATRRRYDELLAAMGRAESKMEPVLVAFNDQVLFLKHNLNARAIASLEGTVGELEQEIGVLIRDMEASIAEANAFIDSMGS